MARLAQLINNADKHREVAYKKALKLVESHLSAIHKTMEFAARNSGYSGFDSAINSELIESLYNPPIKDWDNIKFPIEWENDLGKFKIQEDGRSFIISKMGVKSMELNITILPTGSIISEGFRTPGES
jgi:hypothetical protein